MIIEENGLSTSMSVLEKVQLFYLADNQAPQAPEKPANAFVDLSQSGDHSSVEFQQGDYIIRMQDLVEQQLGHPIYRIGHHCLRQYKRVETTDRTNYRRSGELIENWTDDDSVGFLRVTVVWRKLKKQEGKEFDSKVKIDYPNRHVIKAAKERWVQLGKKHPSIVAERSNHQQPFQARAAAAITRMPRGQPAMSSDSSCAASPSINEFSDYFNSLMVYSADFQQLHQRKLCQRVEEKNDDIKKRLGRELHLSVRRLLDYYAVIEEEYVVKADPKFICQNCACPKVSSRNVLSGVRYSADTLLVIGYLDTKDPATAILLCDQCCEIVRIYHKLSHMSFHLCAKVTRMIALHLTEFPEDTASVAAYKVQQANRVIINEFFEEYSGYWNDALRKNVFS